MRFDFDVDAYAVRMLPDEQFRTYAANRPTGSELCFEARNAHCSRARMRIVPDESRNFIELCVVDAAAP